MEGVIRKALSGFYTVSCLEGTIVCKPRGRFRAQKWTPLVGDRVDVSQNPDGSGNLESILPRKNEFQRPPIANVDCLLILASGAIPVTDPFLIDRITVECERKNCAAAVVLDKTDLDAAEELYSIYANSPYPCFRVSTVTGHGLDELADFMDGKICCLTGNSGVGKSSLLNRFLPTLNAEVKEVSQKLGRGKHTTRHVELYPFRTGFIADTPGFAAWESFAEVPLRKTELESLFPDLAACEGFCRYDDCSHRKEPDCRVRAAVENGALPLPRYNSYVRLYNELESRKDWQVAK